jgi:16S rRNA processing protein RimM
MKDKYIIGKVLKPQGIKGEVKFDYYASNIDYLKSLKTVYVGKTEYSVKTMNIRNGFGYISFTTVEDRNQAELLRNLEIWVEESKAPELEDEEYFTDDLVGCTLVNDQNDILGHIVNIEKYGSADVIEIIGKNGQQSFPYVKGLIKSVDFDEKKIVIDDKRFYEVVINQ